MKELNEIQVVGKSLHAIKNQILEDYTGKFEMVGSLKVGDQIRQAQIRFGNKTDYEAYIISIDEGSDGEDALFNGYIHKTKTFNLN